MQRRQLKYLDAAGQVQTVGCLTLEVGEPWPEKSARSEAAPVAPERQPDVAEGPPLSDPATPDPAEEQP